MTWNATNATQCTASGGWSGPQTTAGTFATIALMVSTTFTLTCNGAGGSVSKSTTVTVQSSDAPTADFGLTPGSVHRTDLYQRHRHRQRVQDSQDLLPGQR